VSKPSPLTIPNIGPDDMMLNGTFPAAMAHLSSLESLSLTQNHISGNLPSELERLTELAFLDLQVRVKWTQYRRIH
jgi:Leucine-rich repeat (LRR) protein